MAFEKELPQWKEKGVKPPQSKIDEGWKVQDKPPAAWMNWQMNKTYEALKEVQEKAAEKTEVASAIEDTKKYTDQKVAGIDLTKITPDSIGAVKKSDFDAHATDGTRHVTAADRNTWNAKETPEGAQAKANTAETNAKNYVNSLQWQRTPVTDGTQALGYSRGDLNADLSTGWYMGSDMVNAPTNEWYYIEVIKHNSTWRVQNAYCFNRNSYYQRMQRNGVWGAWSADVFQSGVDAKNRIAGAINAKGVPASANDDFATLATKIGQINTLATYGVNFSTNISGNDYRKLTITTLPVNSETLVFVPISSFYGSMYVDAHVISGDYRREYPIITFSMKDSSGNSFTIIHQQHSSRTPERMGETIDFHFLMIELKNRVVKYRLASDSTKTINIPANLNLTNPISLEVILRTYGYEDSWGGIRNDGASFNMDGLFYAF